MVVKDDFETNGADYDRQVSLAIASGELPDIMKVGSKDFLDELVENGLVADLTEGALLWGGCSSSSSTAARCTGSPILNRREKRPTAKTPSSDVLNVPSSANIVLRFVVSRPSRPDKSGC